jgi:exodeoxyribonuclease VII small subunit
VSQAPENGRLDRRLDRLEEIVDALDRPDLELEDAMRLFEEGVTHLRAARELLRTAELQVERLLEDGPAGARTEPLDER